MVRDELRMKPDWLHFRRISIVDYFSPLVLVMDTMDARMTRKITRTTQLFKCNNTDYIFRFDVDMNRINDLGS